MIPLDFVPGTHGHFIEYILNRLLGCTKENFDPFTPLGTSHNGKKTYSSRPKIYCNHWYQFDIPTLEKSKQVIRITFDPDDVLLVTSTSLLRAGDRMIDNNMLHIDTTKKLQNQLYSNLLEDIYCAYPDLKRESDIPRYVLREYFKFGFRDFEKNGYWQELKKLRSIKIQNCFEISIKTIYNYDRLVEHLCLLDKWLDERLNLSDSGLRHLHQQFLSKLPYLDNKNQCDHIIQAVCNRQSLDIPKLTLLQESYINGRLEKLVGREMPFGQIEYFTNTQDILYYIDTKAPILDDTN